MYLQELRNADVAFFTTEKSPDSARIYHESILVKPDFNAFIPPFVAKNVGCYGNSGSVFVNNENMLPVFVSDEAHKRCLQTITGTYEDCLNEYHFTLSNIFVVEKKKLWVFAPESLSFNLFVLFSSKGAHSYFHKPNEEDDREFFIALHSFGNNLPGKEYLDTKPIVDPPRKSTFMHLS